MAVPEDPGYISRALKTEPREFFSAEVKIPGQEAAVLADRLNDLSGDVQKMAEIVEDMKGRYLQDSTDNDIGEKNHERHKRREL